MSPSHAIVEAVHLYSNLGTWIIVVMLPQARESTTTGPQNDLGWKGQDGALRWSDPGMLPVLWALDTLRSS